MRILFVDDEARVLDGLRRTLFRQRDAWAMTFVTSGPEALERMALEPFDLIVTDMRMAPMDGATLLERVRLLHPRMVRVVLSGHAEMDHAMRAMTVAHQYLSKPCDAATLVATVEQAAVIRRLLERDEVRELVLRIGSLPPAPSTYARMMRLMSDDHSGIDDFAKLLDSDPGLTAKLLQIANSAYFAGESRIHDAGAAASRIGLRALRSLTLFVEAPAQFGAADATLTEIGLSVAERGQRAAVHARRLCDVPEERESATTAALLHEVGRLALASRLGDDYAAVLAAQRATGRALHEVEREVFGACHAAVGGYLLALWQLPGDVVESIARHHEPGPLPEPLGAAGAVRLAAALAEGTLPAEWLDDPRAAAWTPPGAGHAEAA